MAEADLDDLLDNALEEFQDDLNEGAGASGGDESAVALAASATASSGISKDKRRAESDAVGSDEIGDAMAQLMKDMENPDLRQP